MMKRIFDISGLKRFWHDDHGGVMVVPALIMAPVLFWAIAAVVTFFDAFRVASMSTKASYAISDLLSRETATVNNAYIDNTFALLELMTSNRNEKSGLRVSSISWNAADDRHILHWSEGRGVYPDGTQTLVDTWKNRLPVMVDGESIVVVETRSNYNSPMSSMVNLNNINVDNFVFTRTRFAPQITFSAI